MDWDPSGVGTPLIRLPRFGDGRVFAKAEHLLPSGSVYDRIASRLLAASAGPGPAVVAGSGSLALAFAAASARAGVELVAVVPEDTLAEHRALLAQLRVATVRSPAAEGLLGTAAVARREATSRGGRVVFAPDEPDAAAETFRATLGAELVRTLAAPGAPRPGALVAPVGSGALLTGVARALADAGHAVRSVGTVAASRPTRQDGLRCLGDGAPLACAELLPHSDATALEARRTLARSEGLLVGCGSAAALAAARDLAASGWQVLVLIVDAGDRYFSVDRAEGRAR